MSIFPDPSPMAYEDISLNEDCEGCCRFGKQLAKDGLLRKTLKTFDLSAIPGRFAAQACKRLKHHEKNPARTEAKICHDR